MSRNINSPQESTYVCDVVSLGQVGYRFDFKNIVIYIDPYLTNSVQENEGDDLVRMLPIPVAPNEITDADYVLITHEHRDHCDPDTLIPLTKSSHRARLICPNQVKKMLIDWGINEERIITAGDDKITIVQDELDIYVVPAAHPKIECDSDGFLRYVGYVINYKGRRIYHAGDTALTSAIIEKLNSIGSIDVAFIPVNEQNYYRAHRGIIGNMSIRDAFFMASAIGAKVMVPTHWDMFAVNQVYKEEIELLYNNINPPFHLAINPAVLR